MKKLFGMLTIIFLLGSINAYGADNISIDECTQDILTNSIEISLSVPTTAESVTLILSRNPASDFSDMEDARSSIISFIQCSVTGEKMSITAGYLPQEPDTTHTVYISASCGGTYIASRSMPLKHRNDYILDEFKYASAWNDYTGLVEYYKLNLGMFSLTQSQTYALQNFTETEISSVYKQMFLTRNSFLTVTDIESSYRNNIDAVIAAKSTPSPSPKPPSGGGGGGGAYFKPVELPQDVVKPDINKPVFYDVDDSHWAREAIEYLSGAGVVNGVSETEFNPSGELTREDFITMFARAAKLQPKLGESYFEDVIPSAYYAGYVNAAVDKGIIKGVDEKSFGTGKNLTRQDLALILYRAFFDGQDVVKKPTDWEEISDYAKVAVGVLMEKGIVNGMDDGSFAPMNNSTRAQAAQLIYNLINKGII